MSRPFGADSSIGVTNITTSPLSIKSATRCIVFSLGFKEASFSLWEKETCVGFVGIKIPDCHELLPNTAWLSIIAVKKEEQRKGYGSLLLEKTQSTLKTMGIEKLIVGQDFSCLFSGLPEVTKLLCGFFEKNKYYNTML